MSKWGASRSTILPLPSSPHCAPMIARFMSVWIDLRLRLITVIGIVMFLDFQIALDRNGGLHAVGDDVGALIYRADAEVARRKEAGDFRFHQFVDDHAAVAVGVNQVFDHIRIGKPADEDEDGFGRDVFGLVGLQVADADAVDFVLAVNLLDYAVPDRFDLRVMQVLLDQDLLRGEMVAAMNRINL